jgi:hypothetical protein
VPKITLGEAKESGAVALTIFCASTPVAASGCRHEGKISIGAAIHAWGDQCRLDALPLVCSRCGGRAVDVRPDWGPNTKGGLPLPA